MIEGEGHAVANRGYSIISSFYIRQLGKTGQVVGFTACLG
jgi:hypothetical protein